MCRGVRCARRRAGQAVVRVVTAAGWFGPERAVDEAANVLRVLAEITIAAQENTPPPPTCRSSVACNVCGAALVSPTPANHGGITSVSFGCFLQDSFVT